MSALASIHVGYSRPESEVVKSMLLAYGIPASIRARLFADVQPHLLVALDGLRIEVPRAARVEAAQLIGKTRVPATFPESRAFRRRWFLSSIFFALSLVVVLPCPIWLRWRSDVTHEAEQLVPEP